MSDADNIINVQIEERTLHLSVVDSEAALFSNRNGFAFTMPRPLWDSKGRPGRVKVSGEVVL